MVKINITTLGCPKNIADSGHLAKKFVSEGFVYADEADKADIMLINTCGFIRHAKEESIEEILSLAMMRNRRRKLMVFGCLAKRYKEELLKEIPEIDGIFGVNEEEKIIDYCKHLAREINNGVSGRQGDKSNVSLAVAPLKQTYGSYAYLKIADGCDKKCTFCIIPSIRGRFRSITPENIIKESEELIKSGVKEIILVAQDITSYGKELKEYDLTALLKDMLTLDGDFNIRLLYLYPTSITDELLELMANEDRIHKYLDIPLQHSEDRILRLMGRRGTRKEYIKLIRNIRRKIPQIALRTTFITGFPTESEEEFNRLIDFIEEVRFDRLGVFTYSNEEDTPASKLKGQMPETVKKRRLDEIMKRQSLISLEKNRELIGRRYNAIIDEIEGGLVVARLYSHAPEIDGVVFIEASSDDNLKIGDIVTVEIIDAFDYDLKGIII